MKTNLSIDNIDFSLYITKNGEQSKDYISSLPDRHWNSYYFEGSDVTNIYIFMVEKEKSSSFIQKIESYIEQIDNFPVVEIGRELSYQESYDSFNVLHRETVENYHLFFIDFIPYQYPGKDYKEKEKGFTDLLDSLTLLSDVAIVAGADMNDDNVFKFTLDYMRRQYPEQFNDFFDHEEVLDILNLYDLEEEEQDRDLWPEFLMTKTVEENPKLVLKFIQLYYDNTPLYNEDDNKIRSLIDIASK